MGKTQLDINTYPNNYYLQETSDVKNYTNTLLTKNKKMKGNVILDITAQNGSVTLTNTYTVSNNNILVTSSAQESAGWVVSSTITGVTYTIPVSTSGIVQTEPKTVKSAFGSSYTTVYPSSGKYINQVNILPVECQSKTATPSTVSQTITCDAGYDAFETVTIEPISDEYIIPSGATIVNKTGEINTWIIKNFLGLPIGPDYFNMLDIWKDTQNNIYYSFQDEEYGSGTYYHYKLNKTTFTWESISFNINDFAGRYVWNDSQGCACLGFYYRLDNNSTWQETSFMFYDAYGDESSSFNLEKENFFTYNNNIYFADDYHCSWELINDSIWQEKNIDINISYSNTIYGKRFWNNGSTLYYSDGNNQFTVNTNYGTNEWQLTAISPATSFYGEFVWKYGNNIYLSYTDILDQTSNLWNSITWNGLASFDSTKLWSDGANIYYTQKEYIENESYQLVTYTLDTESGYNNVAKYKYAFVTGESVNIFPTTYTQVITPTVADFISSVVVQAIPQPSGTITLTAQYSNNVANYQYANVTPGTLSVSYSAGGSYYFSRTPTAFPYYIKVTGGWFDSDKRCRLYTPTNLSASNIKNGVTVFGITGTCVGPTMTVFDASSYTVS